MSSKQDIWMPLFIGDYLRDTTRLSTEQHGAYFLLIMDYWVNGAPPDDDLTLANITKMQLPAWRKSKPALSKLFRIEGGSWHHKRIEEELQKAAINKTAKSINGSKGAANKWGSVDTENKKKRSERLANARRLATHSLGEWNALKHVCDESCVRCGSDGELVKDHIKPIYQGGSDGISNLQPLCRKCNSSKGADSTDFRPNDWEKRLAKCLANEWQTPSSSPSPSSDESNIERKSNTPSVENPLSTLSGQICKSLRELGLPTVNPQSQHLNALIEAGGTLEDVVLLAQEIQLTKPDRFNFNYIIQTAIGRKSDAKVVNFSKPNQKQSSREQYYAERDDYKPPINN